MLMNVPHIFLLQCLRSCPVQNSHHCVELVLRTVINLVELRSPVTLRGNIAATQNLDDLFDVLCNTPYWNWMNIKMLGKMAKASHLPVATKLIQQYKEEVYSRKLIEVLHKFQVSVYLVTITLKQRKNGIKILMMLQ